MGTEIERKFLVRSDGWRGAATGSSAFRQGYLAGSETASVRIRIIDGVEGRITIKSATPGLSRSEYEYEIPVADAEELLAMCGDNRIEKRRHKVSVDGDPWIVDVFSGRHDGLVLAEIELDDPGRPLKLPDWLGRDVTGEPDFTNERLARTGRLPA